jgi:aryl-alcohol dehydrogenase-like predicted oxidoreductase
MQKRKLGASDIEVSLVGLGTNNFGGRTDLEASRRVIHRALDLGITLIDTADIYGNKGGSEEILGKVLGPRRKDIVLATKFGLVMDDAGKLRGASRRYIVQALEASLWRLKTDWIDLYQLHRPDAQTPIEETLRALDDLVKSGKVRAIGCSNLSAAQLEEAMTVAQRNDLTSFVTAQDEYSLLDRELEKDRLPIMRKHGMSLLPYFPLASGLLTGKYKHNAPLPAGTRLARNPPRHADEFLNERRCARRLRRPARPHPARAGHELAGEPAVHPEHHCRGNAAGAGGTEYRRGRLGAFRRRSGRDRPHNTLITCCKFAAADSRGRNLYPLALRRQP